KELGFNGHAFLGALKQRENAERRHDQKAIDEFESKLRLMERKIIPIMPQYGAPKLLAELRAARTARAREISVPGMVPGAARRYEADRAGTAVETPARRKAKLILSPDQMKTMRAELVKTATVELPIIKKVDQELSRQAKVDAESRAEADAENKLFADIAAELKSNPALRAEMGTIIREDEIDGEQFLFEIEHQGILAGEISELEKRISSQKAKSGVFRRLLGYGPGSVRELKNQLKEKQRDKAVADKVIDAWKEMALGTMYSGAAYRGKKSKEMTMAERMLNRASERREEAFERMRAIGAGR
ncbi:MAG: hypothetical protein HW383_632, partial [Candidatus Magasanikbacteria bacterium]|nr:hypothetical protein [Candidatus Magasanikbacteria bacterium]